MRRRPARLRAPFEPARAAALAVAGMMALAGPVRAQPEPEWSEATSPSERFVVVSADGADAAVRAAARSDAVHDGLAALFGGRLPGPVTVTIHPTRDAFLAANPLVARAGDTDAMTRRARRAVDVYRRASGMGGEAALERDIRYGLAHLFIARKSGGRMPPGLQEGLARYLADRPSADDDAESGVAAGVARLREAAAAGALLDWSALAAPGAAYLAPELSQPQSLSMVHFLVEREGLAAVLDLVGRSAVTESWREAFEAAFASSPSELEAAWRDWLPGYVSGGWRHHELYLDGIDRAEDLLRGGRYAEARDRLRATLGLIEDSDPAGAVRAKALLARAEAGLRDAETLAAAHSALADGRYRDAQRLAAGLIDAAPEDVEPGRTRSVAAEIARRAAIGLEAAAALDSTSERPAWTAPLSRGAARRAATGFSLLGDGVRAEQARAVHGRGAALLDALGILSIAIGAALLARNLGRRRVAAVAGIGGAASGAATPARVPGRTAGS